MKKIELERMLMDAGKLKELTERASIIRQKEGVSGRTDGNPAEDFRVVEPLSYEVRPTPEEIKENSEDFLIGRCLLDNIARILPEIEKEDPKGVLKILIEKYKKVPSEGNQLLVEDAINRLTLGGLDPDIKKLIDEAIEVLNTHRKTGKGDEKQEKRDTDSIWSFVFQHANYHGNAAFLYHGPGRVYRPYYSDFLHSVHLHDSISSLYVDASAGEVGGLVILFQHNRFRGRYAMFSTTPGDPTWVPYVGNFINDRTSSILIVRRFNNELTIPLVSSYPGDLRDEIRDYVSSIPRISPRGNPIITWDMWPDFDRRRFIYIRIPIRVDVPHWFDYDAEVRYWIYPHVDHSTGTLRAYIAWYGAWVEGGIKTGSILDQLMDNIPSSFGAVNSMLNRAIDAANMFGPFRRQYFLPGTASNQGHTDDDIALVLVRK